MKTVKKKLNPIVCVLFAACLVCPSWTQQSTDFLKGKVKLLTEAKGSLAQKMALSEKTFKKEEKGDFFVTGYAFLSRHEIHHGSGETSLSYRVTEKKNKISIKKETRWRLKEGNQFSTEHGSEVVGLLFLNKMVDKKATIVHTHMIDLDNVYDFKEFPIYWLGQTENRESLEFLNDVYRNGTDKIKKDLVFFFYSHAHPEVYDILKGIASGTDDLEIRGDAIFWMGNFKDTQSLTDLKNLFAKESNASIKEKIIFAIQLSDQPDAVQELIKIAKTESSQKVRKNAIFWVGQKASEECVKALKDVVEGSDEEVEVKESAVFAISQLPKDKAVPMLIDIARTNKSSQVRKNAIFWLGQKDDERAMQFFEEILLKK